MSKSVLISVSLASILFVLGQTPPRKPNRPPVISSFESSTLVLQSPGDSEFAFCTPRPRKTVALSVKATDPDGDALNYEYLVSAGELFGSGSSVNWRIGDQPFGSYSVMVKVTDGRGLEAIRELKVRVVHCQSFGIWGPPCPLIAVSTSGEFTHRGETAFFKAEVSPGYFRNRPDYIWTVTNGRIVKGQRTPSIEVVVTGAESGEVTATVDVGGLDASCSTQASANAKIKE